MKHLAKATVATISLFCVLGVTPAKANNNNGYNDRKTQMQDVSMDKTPQIAWGINNVQNCLHGQFGRGANVKNQNYQKLHQADGEALSKKEVGRAKLIVKTNAGYAKASGTSGNDPTNAECVFKTNRKPSMEQKVDVKGWKETFLAAKSGGGEVKEFNNEKLKTNGNFTPSKDEKPG